MDEKPEAKQATPHSQLISELMDSRGPKTEREHAAAREIGRLRAVLEQTEQEPVAYWLDPDEEPPPVARKLLLLTEGGVPCIGHWGDDCVAWAPLPQVPPAIKEKLLRR